MGPREQAGFLREAFDMLKTTVQKWLDDKASRLAAALSFYTILSLAPCGGDTDTNGCIAGAPATAWGGPGTLAREGRRHPHRERWARCGSRGRQRQSRVHCCGKDAAMGAGKVGSNIGMIEAQKISLPEIWRKSPS